MNNAAGAVILSYWILGGAAWVWFTRRWSVLCRVSPIIAFGLIWLFLTLQTTHDNHFDADLGIRPSSLTFAGAALWSMPLALVVERGPYHGYLFKILTRQGKHAPGGKYDYVINGNMIGGFAMVAWPAEYGTSGVMTFIVNQEGRVYQKDLGPKTSKIAIKMKVYDPDPSWALSSD